MTIIEAINKIDTLKPNTYTPEIKIYWLSKLDGIIFDKIIKTHEGADKEQAINEYIANSVEEYEKSVNEYMKINEVSYEEAKAQIPFHEIKYKEAKEHIEATRPDIMYNGYTPETPMDTKLIISAPYDDIYIKWLESQIDYANREYDKYNNSIVAYNDAYAEYERHYNRTHMPIGKSFKYF